MLMFISIYISILTSNIYIYIYIYIFQLFRVCCRLRACTNPAPEVLLQEALRPTEPQPAGALDGRAPRPEAGMLCPTYLDLDLNLFVYIYIYICTHMYV